MTLKKILYGNSIAKMKLLLSEIKSNGKIKFERRTYKFSLPDVDFSLLSSREVVKLLEIESSNA